MNHYFFDTSAVVKRYVPEIGTAWVRTTLDPTSGHEVHMASLTAVEAISAIARRQRGGTLSRGNANLALSQFRDDLLNQYVVVDITPMLVNDAMQLAEKHCLRGSDALQLAVALEVNKRQALTLVSADIELNAAAGAEGLAVDDPNAHP